MNQKLETCGQGWFEQGAESVEDKTYRVLTPTPPQHLSLNHKLILYTDEVMLNWPLRAASGEKQNPTMSLLCPGRGQRSFPGLDIVDEWRASRV